MLVNPGIKQWFDLSQGQATGPGGSAQDDSRNALAQAIAGIVKPEIGQPFQAPALNTARFQPQAPQSPQQRSPMGAPMTPVDTRGAGVTNYGSAALSQGIAQAGNAIEQGFNAMKARAAKKAADLAAISGRGDLAPFMSGGSKSSTGGASPSGGGSTGTGGTPVSGLNTDQLQDAAQDAGYGTGTPKPLVTKPGVDTAHVNPALLAAVTAGASHLPQGYTVRINEGYNPSGHVANSQHHIAGEGALDVQIIGPDGKEIPNKGTDTTGKYAELAQHTLGELSVNNPELAGKLAWGGNFGTVSGGSTPDLMHFDLGGDRGSLGPRMAERGFSSVPDSPGFVPAAMASGSTPSSPQIGAAESYIRDAAIKRGIDPDIAVKVANSEGLGAFKDGIPATDTGGDSGTSFGPFQLHYGGGLGDDFTKKTGLDARDPTTYKQQTDFALDNAAKNGWGAFHGAKDSGVGSYDGIMASSTGTPSDTPLPVPRPTQLSDVTSQPTINPMAMALVSGDPNGQSIIQALLNNVFGLGGSNNAYS